MFDLQYLLRGLWLSRDEAPPPETDATPTVAADATPRPPSPQTSAPSDESLTHNAPVYHVPKPVSGPSVSSPPQESSRDGPASGGVTHTTYGAVSFGGSSSKLSLRLVRNSTPIPSFQEEAHGAQHETEDEVSQEAPQVAVEDQSEADLEQKILDKQKALQKLRKKMRRRARKKALRSLSDRNDESDVPKGSCSGVGARRSKRSNHKSDPYEKSKVKKGVKFPDPPFEDQHDGESYQYSPTRLPPLPTLHDEHPRYRTPTPYRRPIELPSDDVDEENLAPTRSDTPPPTEPRGLGLLDMESRIPVRRPTLEKIDIPANATPAVDHAVTPKEAPDLHTFNPDSTSPPYLTPASSTPGLYADSRRATSPAESPLPKTPIDESNGFESQVADSSSYAEMSYEALGGPGEDSDDLGPTPRRENRKAATVESTAAPPPQQPLPPLPAPVLAPLLAETVVVSDIPARSPPAPPTTFAAPAPQREMSWTTLPISSLPAAPQPFQLQPQSTLTQPSVVWGQVPPLSSWEQSPFSVPPSTSTWMAAPVSAPSSFPTQSASSFSQPIAIPQLPSFVQHATPPLVLQPEADMSMDVDAFVSASSPCSTRQRRVPIRDYRRTARQLLRVTAIEPGLDLRKRAARRMLRHLFAIRQHSIIVNAFRGQHALRKSLAIQRRNRQALRQARRSVRQTLRRSGRAARSSGASPQSAPRLIQRTMSIEMAVGDSSSRTSVDCTDDVDVDMDGGDLPAILTTPTVEVVDETMVSEDVFQTQSPVPQMLADEPAQLPIEPSVPIPTIVVTPETPLPEPQLQKELRASPEPEPSISAPSLLSESFVPRPAMIMPSDSGKTKPKTASPLRQGSSLAEFEVPLTKAAAPADVHDPALAPAPVVVAVLTPAAIYSTVVEAQSESESSVPETEPPVTETETEQQSVESDAGEETDDETEWEPVPVPAIAAVSPATPTAEAAPVEESTSAADTENESKTAPVEQEPPTEDDAPIDVPLPNIAGEGPEIFLSSNESDSEDDDDDVVSLDASEDERERRLFYGEEYADEGEDDEDDEDYEDDGAEHDEQAAKEGTEEEETEEEEEEDGEEESNEYDETAPINGPITRPSASAPASALPNPSPVPTPAPAPAVATVKGPESLSMPIPASSTLPPSSFPTGGLTGGPYIGTVGEGYNNSAGYRYSNNLLSNAANVSSGSGLNGEAGLQAREAARRRNYENKVQQRNRVQNLIQSIKDTPALPEAPPSPVLPETTTSGISDGASTVVVDQDVPESHPPSQDLSMTKDSKEVLMSPDEDAENHAPRLDKGKGKATDEDVLLADRVTVPYLDPSSKTIADGMGLSPAEVQLNIDAFPKADSKGEAPLSSECSYGCLLNGPSSGHTLACQRARGVFTTPLVVPKSSSHSGLGHSVRPSPADVLSAPASDQYAEPSVIEVSPQDERPPSALKTEVNMIPIDQGASESTQVFVGLSTTSLPAAYEQQLPITEFLEDGMDQQFTGPTKAWVDLFVNPVQAATAEASLAEASTQEPPVSIPDFTFQSLPTSTLPPSTIHPSALDFCVEAPQIFNAGTTLTRDDASMGEEIHFSPPAETAPFAGIDFSAYPSGLGPEIVLDEPSSDVLLSIPDQENMFTVDFGSQAAVFALPVSGSVDGCVPDTFPQTHEGNSAILREAHHGEMGEVDVDVASYALGAPSSDEQLEYSVEASAPGYAPFDEQPRLESDISVLAAAEAGVDTRTESSVQEVAISQAQPPFEQSQPADCAPLPSVELEVALLPTRTPTPPPSVPQEEVVHPIVEESTGELPHIESAPNLVGKQEAEDKTSAADVPVPSSTPLIRRRSGGPHDRIAFPHEKRMYYGPRPSSAQWQAYLRAGSPRVERPPSCAANKSSSPLPPPALRLPAHPCGPNPLRSTSTSPDATAVTEPTHPHIPSRGRPRRRPTIPATVDRSKSKQEVTPEATEMDVSPATTKHRRSKGNATSKEATHVPTSSASSASHPACLPPSDCPSAPLDLGLPSWAKPPCCPDFSRTGRKPCIHALRANGQLAGTRWESESSDSELEEEKDALSSAEQGWSAGYLAKLSLAAGALYFLESVVF